MQPTHFGNYQLLEILSRGAMGDLWRAYDPQHERLVAVRVLPAAFTRDVEFAQRFHRDMGEAARLQHAHLVPFHDAGTIDNRLFVARALIDGQDLQSVLDDGPLPPSQAVHILEQVASALDRVHRFGLVHGDVKPSNILVDRADLAYLDNLGIGHAVPRTGVDISTSMIAMWAPERLFESVDDDTRSDIYALTGVLHQMLTGQPPFTASNFEGMLAAHMATPPPRPSEVVKVSAAMDKVIAVGMAKNPAHRFASAPDLARAAAKAASEPILSEPRPPLLSQSGGAPPRFGRVPRNVNISAMGGGGWDRAHATNSPFDELVAYYTREHGEPSSLTQDCASWWSESKTGGWHSTRSITVTKPDPAQSLSVVEDRFMNTPIPAVDPQPQRPSGWKRLLPQRFHRD